MLLAWGLLLLGLGACNDQLLPPPAGEDGGGTREALVYYNDLGANPPTIDTGLEVLASTVRAVRPDGTSRRAIISGYVSSSPQHGKVAVFSQGADGLGSPGIWIANEDGSDARLVEPLYSATQSMINPYAITLGPDGMSYAWIAANEQGDLELRVRTASNRWIMPLGLAASGDATTSVPSFSPDGRWVAYANPSIDATGGEIVLISTSSGATTSIDAPLVPTLATYVAPPFDWSSDGRRLVYAGWVEDDTTGFSTELMTLDVASSARDTLTHDQMLKESPRWLPSGGICYFAFADNGMDMFLRDEVGTSRRLTFEESTYKLGLTISPDGRTVMYTEIGSPDQFYGNIRTYDLAKRSPGPVLATNTDLAYWRR
jgi:Tol biopolymer transport system component